MFINAGVLELADEADSKSSSLFYLPIAGMPDNTRLFTNQYFWFFRKRPPKRPPISKRPFCESFLKISFAGMMELADVTDSKSVGLILRAGSSPASGTIPKPFIYAGFGTFFSVSHTSFIS